MRLDEIEVDSRSGDLAREVRKHAWAVLDIDHDDFTLAGDRDVGDRQRMLRGLGVRDEDVKLRPAQLARRTWRRWFTPASLIAATSRASAQGENRRSALP